MPSRFTLILPILALAAPLAGQMPSASDWANMQQDVRGLNQRLGDMSMRLEEVERENAELKSRARSTPADVVTTVELNRAVASLNSAIQAAVTSSRTDILQQVGTQMEKLARQTNAALDSLARSTAGAAPVEHAAAPRLSAPPPSSAAAAAPAPGDGGRYVVQKGDTIDSIAKKSGRRPQEIISANKLAEPYRIHVGQSLVLPGNN